MEDQKEFERKLNLNFRPKKSTTGEKTLNLTEYSTDVCHCLEDHTGETGGHFDIFHIGKLQQQRFVLGCVEQISISLCVNKSGFPKASKDGCIKPLTELTGTMIKTD